MEVLCLTAVGSGTSILGVLSLSFVSSNLEGQVLTRYNGGWGGLGGWGGWGGSRRCFCMRVE
jgi:hypothetical protein